MTHKYIQYICLKKHKYTPASRKMCVNTYVLIYDTNRKNIRRTHVFLTFLTHFKCLKDKEIHECMCFDFFVVACVMCVL